MKETPLTADESLALLRENASRLASLTDRLPLSTKGRSETVTLALLGVPSSAGAYGIGLEQAPRALRQAGLTDALRKQGIAVIDTGDTPTVTFRPDPISRTAQNLGQVVEVAGEVARRVANMVADGLMPLVVGGDCTITVGVVAGMLSAGDDVALGYFDGDADLSTPRSTRSGVLDAMGVAHLLGVEGAAEELAAIGPRRPLLPGQRLALIGFEDSELDERDRALLSEHAVHQFPADLVRADATDTAARVLAALSDGGRLVLHFDLDAVDSIDSPLAHFPHFNTGVSLETATGLLAGLCSAPNLGAVVVTEVNPQHDPDGSEVRRLIQSLATALAQAPILTSASGSR